MDLSGLSQGGSAVSLSINGQMVRLSNTGFPGVNFNSFNGPLYIGGHPSLATIGVSGIISTVFMHVFIVDTSEAATQFEVYE